MKKLPVLALAALLSFAVACKNDKKKDDNMSDEKTEMSDSSDTMAKKAKVTLEAKSGSNVSGSVVFKQEGDNVTMTAIIAGLAEGKHAIHIHETGDCTAADGTSAGGHWNPTSKPHGKWGSPDGFHKGDIGNFNVDANGNGTVNLTTDEWCIGCGDANKDILNKSIIIHDGVDDFTSQPSGAAGTRVGCGVINMM